MSDLFIYLPSHFFTLVLLGLVFITGLFFLFEIKKSQYIIYLLLVWLPLESVILRYTPIDYYSYVKYFPEILLYATVLLGWLKFMFRKFKFYPDSPINRWLLVFVVVSFVSLLLNWYHPIYWLLGLRQLLRFALVFFLILLENYSRETKYNFIKLGLAIIFLEAIFGIVQYLAGGKLDQYLFFSEAVTVGSARLGAIEQFWAPGSRVFATLGRYDRLGSLLALGLTALFPWLYCLKKEIHKILYWTAFGVISLALILTYSRASWLSALFGIIFIGLWVMRDERVKKVLRFLTIILFVYLSAFAVLQGNVAQIVDKPVQPLSERILEAVSWRSWQGSYEGYGRIFFIVNTPLRVVADSPLFGVGLGNYGGGVAAAFMNTAVYDRLHLPFGVQNVFGQIDNNWWSIWGETGTLGLLAWIMVLWSLFVFGKNKSWAEKDPAERALARGLVGAVIGIMIVGFFGPYFEFRTLMFYFWVLAGCVVSGRESVK